MREKLEQLVEALCNAKLYHWARRVEAILNSQPSFVPGMVIGPGHGRRFTHTLEKFYRYDTHDSSEIWYTKDANGLHFYPDDLRDRVLYDPRMATAEDFQKSTKLLGELSKQIEAQPEPPAFQAGPTTSVQREESIKAREEDLTTGP